MKITVSEDNIDWGLTCDSGKCPIALACQEAGLENPSVGHTEISYGPSGARVHHWTPEEVKKVIEHYDISGEMLPFEFELGEPRNGIDSDQTLQPNDTSGS